MQRCSRCRITYEEVEYGQLICFRCGDQLPGLKLLPAEGGASGNEASPVADSESANVPAAVAQPVVTPRPQATSDENRELVPHSQSRSPGLAALLSFLLVGMGQIYLGQIEKGLCVLAVVLLLVMSAAPSPLGMVILALNVLDAFLLGKKVKRGHQIRRWQFFFHSK